MKEIKIQENTPSLTILDELKRQGIYINAACNGNGTCGKCKVIAGGKEVLACQTSCAGISKVLVPDTEEDITIEDDFSRAKPLPIEGKHKSRRKTGYAVCIDIGTTTLAAARLDLSRGEIIAKASSINHQRQYGADVISRIKAATDGSLNELKHLIQNDVKSLLTSLKAEPSDQVIISGNTTMEHLYLGYPCNTLGISPYTPVDISLQQGEGATLLPGVSTFVGADIVSGIYALEMDKKNPLTLMIDLGTNGEMALGNKEKILVTSTAAGPAFEAANISCGVASIPGAIGKVKISEGNQVTIETIDEAPAIGICGTGVIDMVAQLLDAGLIDETGLLDEEFFDSGFPLDGNIVFTQKDIREVQMAKAAVRAGLETLIKEYGTTYENIEALYLSGGFGKKINIESACRIGLIPRELSSKTVAMGNTSLAGAIKFALDEASENIVKAANKCIEISLAESKVFNDYYMECMYFE